MIVLAKIRATGMNEHPCRPDISALSLDDYDQRKTAQLLFGLYRYSGQTISVFFPPKEVGKGEWPSRLAASSKVDVQVSIQ